jgi:hypothetical protein
MQYDDMMPQQHVVLYVPHQKKKVANIYALCKKLKSETRAKAIISELEKRGAPASARIRTGLVEGKGDDPVFGASQLS